MDNDIKKRLSIHLRFDEAGFYETNHTLKVSLLLDNEVISEDEVYIPDTSDKQDY